MCGKTMQRSHTESESSIFRWHLRSITESVKPVIPGHEDNDRTLLFSALENQIRFKDHAIQIEMTISN